MPFGLASICREEKWKRTDWKKVNSNEEPSCVHLMRRSPTRSPPTSVSTLSSSAAADKKDEWANELQPILALDHWDPMLPDPIHDHSLLRWIAAGDIHEASLLGLKHLLHSNNTSHLDFAAPNSNLGFLDQGSVLDPIGTLVSGSGSAFPSPGFYTNVKSDHIPVTGDSSVVGSTFSTPHSNTNLTFQQPQSNQFVDEKPQPLLNQNPNFLIPPPFQEHHHIVPPPSKRHNSFGSDNHLGIGHGHDTNLQQVFPQQQRQFQLQPAVLMAAKQGEEEDEEEETARNVLDQLYKAAEMVGTANFSHAQAILARLNHQMSPIGKPLLRAAYYFKEALQSLLFGGGHTNNNNPANANHPSFDVILKMGAYKAFSEISPLLQFANFSANQAFLEALDRCHKIHIVDFDIGFGAQWASFLQELPLRRNGVASVRITAVTSPSTHHPVELALMHESLTQFSHEVGVSLELQVLNVDCLEQQDSEFMAAFRADEVVAVNLPVWCSSGQSARFPSLLRFIKRLSPRILVCLDSAYTARTDLPFPQQVLHSLHSCSDLLESLDAASVAVVNTDVVSRIERFFLLPRIESALAGRLCSDGDRMPQWRTMVASVGLTPLPFSNFAEAQADCLVKRTPAQGFHVDKRHGSLVLCWQRRELVAVSAWSC